MAKYKNAAKIAALSVRREEAKRQLEMVRTMIAVIAGRAGPMSDVANFVTNGHITVTVSRPTILKKPEGDQTTAVLLHTPINQGMKIGVVLGGLRDWLEGEVHQLHEELEELGVVFDSDD